MGGLLSKSQAQNTVNSMINAGISVMNTQTQSCYASAASVQGLSFNNITGNIDLENLNWKQIIVMKSDCMASMTSSTVIQQAVDSKLTSMASAIAGSLSLGQTDTNNLIKASVDLSQRIVNAFSQSCKSSASNQQVINFNGVVGNIKIGYANWDQMLQITTKCVLDAVMNTDSTQQITQIIDASAKSKNEGLTDIIKYIIIGLVVVCGLAAAAAIVLGPKLLASGPDGGPPPILKLAALA